jgi:hypothetical protein
MHSDRSIAPPSSGNATMKLLNRASARLAINSLLGAFVLMFLSVSVHAAEAWHTSRVRMVYPLGDGQFVLTLAVDATACLSQNQPKYYYITVGQNGVNAEGAKRMYAAALLALAQDLPVTFAFQTDSSGCYINRMAVVRP